MFYLFHRDSCYPVIFTRSSDKYLSKKYLSDNLCDIIAQIFVEELLYDFNDNVMLFLLFSRCRFHNDMFSFFRPTCT